MVGYPQRRDCRLLHFLMITAFAGWRFNIAIMKPPTAWVTAMNPKAWLILRAGVQATSLKR
jgi:hypothetical protein